MTKQRYTIAYVASDEFNSIPGSGWVILLDGKRVDWPMLAARDEAQADLIDFRRECRALASDEASEARFYNR